MSKYGFYELKLCLKGKDTNMKNERLIKDLTIKKIREKMSELNSQLKNYKKLLNEKTIYHINKDIATKEIKQFFIKSNPYAALVYKINILEKLVRNYDEYNKYFEFTDILKDETIDKEKIILSLKSEIYFEFFHISEVFFALIYAFWKEIVDEKINMPWFWMSNYTFPEMNKFVENIKTKKIIFDYNNVLPIFYNLKSNYKGNNKEALEKSVSFISQFVIKLAEEYLKNKERYNSYKHGSRVCIDNHQEGLNVWDIHIDIGEKNIKTKSDRIFKTIVKKIKSFDWERASRISKVALSLIQNMIITRKQLYEGSQKVKWISFEGYNIDELFKEDICLNKTMEILTEEDY